MIITVEGYYGSNEDDNDNQVYIKGNARLSFFYTDNDDYEKNDNDDH